MISVIFKKICMKRKPEYKMPKYWELLFQGFGGYGSVYFHVKMFL